MANQPRSIPRNVERALWAESLGRCANPDCLKDLLINGTWVGEIAHIVPHADGGPATSENLLSICPTCHTLIDKSRDSQTIDLLRTWKRSRQSAADRLFAQRFDSFAELASEAIPLLVRNRQIWEEYGPQSTEADAEGLRKLWERFEPEILSNNQRLVALFTSNKRLFPDENWKLVERFQAHSTEFEQTRDAGPKSRRILFPERLNAVFGLEVVGDSAPEYGLSALQNFVATLIREGRFIKLALFPNEEVTGCVEYVDNQGNQTSLFLNNTPRLKQEYWLTYAFRPHSERTRLRDLLFVLRYFERRSIPWSHRDPTQLHEVTIRGGQRVYLLYKYIVERDTVQALNAPAGSVVVNQHRWNGGPFTNGARSLAVEEDLLLLNQEHFFGWLHTGMLPTERRLRDTLALVPLSAINRLFLFGSALLCDRPGDIDLVAIYSDGASSAVLNDDRTRIDEALRKNQWDPPLDFTSLSESELSQTRFLDNVPHREIPI